MKKLLAISISMLILSGFLASCKPQKPQNAGGDTESVYSIQSEISADDTNSDTTTSEIEQNVSSQSQNKPTSSNKTPDKTSSQDKTTSKKPTSSKNDEQPVPSQPMPPEVNVSGEEYKQIKPVSREDYHGWKYLKSKGTQGEQKAYIAFEKAFSQFEKTVAFDFKVSAIEVNRAYEVYMEDHPEEFFLGKASYTMDSKDNVISFTVKSDMMSLPRDKVIEMKSLVQQKVYDIILELFPNGVYKNEIETVRAVHDYLVNNIKYDTTLKADHSHDMYGALINGTSVCEGYAESFLYIMRLCGIECLMVNGTLSNQSHVWNMIKLEDEWYHIDVTSDDPILSSGEQVLRFEYFNITENEIRITHTIVGNITDIPKATSSKYNFFKYYGLEYSSINDDVFVNSISFSLKNGYKYAYFKFANNTPSNAVDHYLKNSKTIAAIVNGKGFNKQIVAGGSVSYSQNKTKNILNLELRYK